MSLNIKETKKETNYTPAPEGSHVAILYSIVDMGTHTTVWQGQEKNQQKVRLTFELPNELKEFDGESKPMVMGAEYTVSLADLSKLKPIIEGLMGRKLTDAEKANFSQTDFEALLGKTCMISVVHNESDGNTYANIATVSPLLKGVTVPAQVNPNVIYDIAQKDDDTFKSLPEFMQKKIKLSQEWNRSFETDAVEAF
jgi:hypothetical protein